MDNLSDTQLLKIADARAMQAVIDALKQEKASRVTTSQRDPK